MAENSQVAIITGAGRGIGRAMAERYAMAGWKVALVSRSAGQLEEVEKTIKDSGGQALAVPTDVTNQENVRQSVQRIQDELGPVEVLVNNAGSFDCIGPVAEIDPEVWWRDCEINLRGPLLTCHAVLPSMIEQKRGVIVNVIGGGTGNPFPFGSGYASSKAGLMRLTECLAGEVKEQGILVFAMGPGFVRTQMTEYQVNTEAGRKYIPSSQDAFEAGKDIPPTRAAELAFQLAARRDELTPLTGRLFSAGEDLDQTIDQIEQILADNKRTLRFC